MYFQTQMKREARMRSCLIKPTRSVILPNMYGLFSRLSSVKILAVLPVIASTKDHYKAPSKMKAEGSALVRRCVGALVLWV